MNLKQFTILLLGCELQYISSGWPPVVGTIMGAIICLSADAIYERRQARNEYSVKEE